MGTMGKAKYMRLMIPMVALTLFLWLVWYSLMQDVPYDVSGLNNLVAGQKFADASAQALSDVYGVSAEEAGKPVELWK